MSHLIKAGQSYSIITKSDIVFNLILGYIYDISEPLGIYKAKAIFGKYILISDTALPAKNRVVISRKERSEEEFESINVNYAFVQIFAQMLDNDDKEFLAYCKKHLKKNKIEVAYYYMCAISTTCFTDGEFNEAKANLIINSHSYRGVHSVSDKYATLISFVSYPTEENLSELFFAFNDENGGFDSLISLVSIIVEESKIPEYIVQKYSDDLNDPLFIRGLLTLCTALLNTKTKDEFILYCLLHIIKKG